MGGLITSAYPKKREVAKQDWPARQTHEVSCNSAEP
jgi:hypothetical protein